MDQTPTTTKKLDELYNLIEQIEIAMMTTRRPDGHLVTRPMATQERQGFADLWFVTNVEDEKVKELQHDPHICLGYLDNDSMEWVSVSGTARITQDRQQIRDLRAPDWKAWFGDEGGERDGGPNDPRLALIEVDATSVIYMVSKHSKPRILFEIAKGMITGEQPDIGRTEKLGKAELD